MKKYNKKEILTHQILIGDGDVMDKYQCENCSYIYDPVYGDPKKGIKPGTPFEKISPVWTCPVCGAGKRSFTKVQ